MAIKTATLIVLTATGACHLDEVDQAAITSVPFGSIESCQTAAEILDGTSRTRAWCLPDTAQTHGEADQ
jgi:hypothetical protein